MIDIESMTLREIRELKALLSVLDSGTLPPATPHSSSPDFPIPLGKPVCVETILPCYVGTLAAVTPTHYVLTDASWVSNMGRYSEFARTGDADEVEPLPDGPLVVERSAVLSVRPHPKTLRTLK